MRHVVHVERRVAGLTRPHEQRNVIAPRHKGPLEQTAAFAPALHEGGELLRLPGLERNPALHVHTGKQPRCVHAMVDVFLFDVRLIRGTGAREDVAIACRIDDNSSANRLTPTLALEHYAAHTTILNDGVRGPGVIDQLHALVDHHVLRQQLEALRINRGRPGDDAAMRRRALLPMLDARLFF